MANFLILILLTSCQGIQCIFTVNTVEVQEGMSIFIPCQYDTQHKDQEKFFYYYWNGKRKWYPLVNTNSQAKLGTFSISDDKTQSVITVIMRDVRIGDEGLYGCAVTWDQDDYKDIFISVTAGSPRLYVLSQHVTGYEGDSVTINCYHNNLGKKKWCRIDGICTWRNGMSVKMNDDYYYGYDHVLMVTLRGWQMRHTGWYYCSVGDLQMPVYISVEQKITTQKTTTLPAISTTTMKTTSTAGDMSLTSSTKTQTPKHTVSSGGFSLTLLLGLLGVLLLVVICGVLILIKLRNHRCTAGTGEAVVDNERSTAIVDDDTHGDVTYSTVVVHNRSLKKSLRYQVAEVIYSEVAAK